MKKRDSAFAVLTDIFGMVPWWVGPIVAITAYPIFRYIVPHLISHAYHDPKLAPSFTQTLATFARAIAPFVSLFVLLIWGVALVKKKGNRRRRDGITNIEDVRKLSWREFEFLVGEFYRRDGYEVEEIGGASADGGVDILLRRGGQTTPVQCKHWKTRQVGVAIVRELRGVMNDQDAEKGIVVCLGEFTQEAREFADRNGISLVTGPQLAEMIEQVKAKAVVPTLLPSPSDTRQPRAAPEMEMPATPCCPICGSPMAKRTARKGARAGSEFWGCQKYPACKGTQSIS